MTAPCCPECGQTIPRKTRIAARMENITWLLEMGVGPQQIAEREGVKPESLGAWLARHGRNELARPFFRATWREQWHNRRRAA